MLGQGACKGGARMFGQLCLSLTVLRQIMM